ncbi:MAG: TMAO reductase system periplasmic protein TorT [Gammaproteobacteria bacterium]|nr:TMAO reductase system periplasmic protein TorT [Gammaproteobacteria bacterium]
MKALVSINGRMTGAAIVLIVMVGFASGAVEARDWYPLEVDVWEPPFNTQRQRVQKSYVPLEKAERRWNLCVSIPHLKDAYWLAVNFGLVDEARRLGVNLAIYEAGGYDRLEVQRKQITECLEEGFNDSKADGLILSAISADGLNDLIKTTHAQGVPVLDLINGISSPDITARAAVDYYDDAFQAGEYLKKLATADKGEVKVAWFPGPEGAAWVAAGDRGFNEALAGSHIKIIATKKGDTGKAAQAKLIETVLDDAGKDAASRPDYIVGTTVSAEAAVSILRQRGLDKEVKVLSYYYGPGVHRGIKRGTIIAAPTDSQAIQARMAVDIMVRILEGKPYFKHASPRVRVIDRNNQRDWDSSTTLAPRGFRAIFSVQE